MSKKHLSTSPENKEHSPQNNPNTPSEKSRLRSARSAMFAGMILAVLGGAKADSGVEKHPKRALAGLTLETDKEIQKLSSPLTSTPSSAENEPRKTFIGEKILEKSLFPAFSGKKSLNGHEWAALCEQLLQSPAFSEAAALWKPQKLQGGNVTISDNEIFEILNACVISTAHGHHALQGSTGNTPAESAYQLLKLNNPTHHQLHISIDGAAPLPPITFWSFEAPQDQSNGAAGMTIDGVTACVTFPRQDEMHHLVAEKLGKRGINLNQEPSKSREKTIIHEGIHLADKKIWGNSHLETSTPITSFEMNGLQINTNPLTLIKIYELRACAITNALETLPDTEILISTANNLTSGSPNYRLYEDLFIVATYACGAWSEVPKPTTSDEMLDMLADLYAKGGAKLIRQINAMVARSALKASEALNKNPTKTPELIRGTKQR